MSRLEMNSKTFGIVGLVSQLKSGQINRDAEMQRSYVWSNKEQTEFLDSVFQWTNTYIPPIIGAESEQEIEIKGKLERIIDLLDGKQRTTTLEKFLNNEIKLGNNITAVTIEQEDGKDKTYNIAGMTWDEIPEEVKTHFKACRINMVFFKNMSYADRERQFIKLQGGKKLTNAEVNKVRIGQELREFIYKQLTSELWTKYSNVSNNRETKFETMQQVIMVMSGELELSGKALQDFAEHAQVSNELLEKIEAITEYLNTVTKTIKLNTLPVELRDKEESEIIEILEKKALKKYMKPLEYLKKVNLSIIYSITAQAIENGVNEDQFANFLDVFFDNVPASYKRATEGKSADSSSVRMRLETMEKHFKSQFSITEQEQDQEQTPNQEQPEKILSLVN